MKKNKATVVSSLPFGVEPRFLTAAQRRELFIEGKKKMIEAGELDPFEDDDDHRGNDINIDNRQGYRDVPVKAKPKFIDEDELA